MAKYTFEKFVKSDHPSKRKLKSAVPERMSVGQIVVRQNCTEVYKYQLKRRMLKAMHELGMEFSIANNASAFAIRRDK